MKWTDTYAIAEALYDQHPEVNPLTIRFTDLMAWTMALDGFDDSESHCGEKILEAIQSADRRGQIMLGLHDSVFLPLFWLFVKHFVCDFPLQAFPWIYRNKGRYLHPGGLVHAGLHGIGTYLALFTFLGENTLLYALIDMLTHYHIDWVKMNLNNKHDLKPDNSEWFWILLGIDQLLHHLTYFAIVYFAFQL